MCCMQSSCAYVRTYVRMYKSTFNISGHSMPLMKEVKALYIRSYVHMYVPARFCHCLHESVRNSCLDFFCVESCGKSQRNREENPSSSAWISVSACTGESRNSSKKRKLSVSSTLYCGHQPCTAPALPAVCALSCWGSSSRCRHRSPAQGGLGRRSRTRSFWEGPPARCPWCLVFLTPGEACSSTHSGDPCTDLVGEEGWGRWRYV